MALIQSGNSRPDSWLSPRPALDPVMRRMTYGPIRPMNEDRDRPFWRRLFNLT